MRYTWDTTLRPAEQESASASFGISLTMPDLPSPASYQILPKGPNFLLIVLLAGVALAIMLVLAYFIVLGAGEVLLPSAHGHGESTARLALSALSRLAA